MAKILLQNVKIYTALVCKPRQYALADNTFTPTSGLDADAKW